MKKRTRTIEELIASSGYDPDDPLLTASQVAAVLSVSPETVRRWMRKGALKCEMVGPERKLRRVRRSVVRQFHVGADECSTNHGGAHDAHSATLRP